MKTYLLTAKEKKIVDDYLNGDIDSSFNLKRIIGLWKENKGEILDDIQLLVRTANYLKYEGIAHINAQFATNSGSEFTNKEATE